MQSLGIKILSFVIFFALSFQAQASPSAAIDQGFVKWTQAFNNKNLLETCDFFAKNLVFEFQGQPVKNHAQVCDNFKLIFKQNKRYHYRYKIQQIYLHGNFASVRITWFLDIYENNKLFSSTQEQGMDVLKKGLSGVWKIQRSFSYPNNC
jgi:ketosteroid isomerase-like protein